MSVDEKQALAKREKRIRLRAKKDLHWFAPNCLKIIVKDNTQGGSLVPFQLNEVQDYIHAKLEAQLASLGYIRALILKGRQQGASTYTEGRYYWKVIHRKGVNAYILTHSGDATENIFGMVERYHDNCPPLFKPYVGKRNARELEFTRLDSRYIVATAGAKGAGRSRTVHFFHGSEVAFWEHAKEHMSGALQAVPEAPGTEVILESTANGTANEFYRLWCEAEAGRSDFIAIFVPWFWQEEYQSPIPDGFVSSDMADDVPEGELTEADYQQTYKLTDPQMMWRRKKIAELGYWEFKREYPATAAEAFQASGEQSLIPVNLIVKARKAVVNAQGSLLIGVDPARYGDDGFAVIRRRGRRAYDHQVFNKLSIPQGAALVGRIIKNEQPLYVFIDVGGLGAGVVDILLESKYAKYIVPVNFGGSPLNVEKFRNKKAEMYGLMKEWFETPGGVQIPDADIIQSEITSIRYTYDGAQRLQIESKEAMRKRGVKSPDVADALATTFAYPVSVEGDLPGVGVDQQAGWPDREQEIAGNNWSVFD